MNKELVDQLRELLSAQIMFVLKPRPRKDLPALCDELDLPCGDDGADTKAEYIESRLAALDEAQMVVRVVELFIRKFPLSQNESTFEIEEFLWSAQGHAAIPKRFRRDVVDHLGGHRVHLHGGAFIKALEQLWVIDKWTPELTGTLRDKLKKWTVQNDDLSVADLCELLGAFDVSDRRFALLLEALVSPNVRPSEDEQRRFVKDANEVLAQCGVELREIGEEDGYPKFAIVSKSKGAQGKPKNLIFASQRKPDIRFADAITNEIEIVTNEANVLVYDRPIPANGLRWRDLQTWWAEKHRFNDTEAKATLYRRLRESLPNSSPPQDVFFVAYHEVYGKAVPNLPALLPEVWLHWDPKTVAQRGRDALLTFRMDFLMLISHETRIVIEIDGKQHYADGDKADPRTYAQTMKGDRELRLAGYEVYRFAGVELGGESGKVVVRDFFDRLFKRHCVLPF